MQQNRPDSVSLKELNTEVEHLRTLEIYLNFIWAVVSSF